jgi:SnoaL-like domain
LVVYARLPDVNQGGVPVADHFAINELFAWYAWGMDSGQFSFTRDTFTADASFSLDIVGEPVIDPINGGEAIGDFIETTTREQTDQRRHVITNVHLENEQDDSATAIAYLSLMVTEAGRLRPQATGVYTTEAVHDRERWRFRRLHLTLDRPF